MNKQKTITINGVEYDAHTGLRTEVPEHKKVDHKSKQTIQSHVVHKKAARTQTLNRAHVKSPNRVSTSTRQHVSTPKPVTHTKSPMIHKFSPTAPKRAPVAPQRAVISDMAPIKHPLQTKALHAQKKSPATKPVHARVAATHTPQHTQPKPAAEIKQSAIAKAMAQEKPAPKKKLSFAKRHPRLVNAGSASLAVVLLAGYLTYVNLPNLSVRVAAVQAGVNANYPSYHPSGYSLNGPVAYSDGEVSMKFAANVGSENFTVKQTKSSWDSSALLDNYVQQHESDYVTFNDSGLTIYVYDTNAAWVNGGVLHTIEGSAPLTNDQIRRIATSM